MRRKNYTDGYRKVWQNKRKEREKWSIVLELILEVRLSSWDYFRRMERFGISGRSRLGSRRKDGTFFRISPNLLWTDWKKREFPRKRWQVSESASRLRLRRRDLWNLPPTSDGKRKMSKQRWKSWPVYGRRQEMTQMWQPWERCGSAADADARIWLWWLLEQA